MTLRVVVVTQDDLFYLPVFFRSFFDSLPSIVSIDSIVVLPTFDEPLTAVFHRMLRFYGPIGFINRACLFTTRLAFDTAGFVNYSVASIAKSNSVDVRQRSSINTDDFIQYVKVSDIDVVLSAAAPEIFNESLLATPEWCVNVHTADLPKYRGMMPTFWALYHGETELGVTVHTMGEEIDKGEIITKEFFNVSDMDSLHEVIRRGKTVGGGLAAEVLETIAKGEVETKPMKGPGSYFSFPTREDRREFQRRGYRLL